MICSVSPCRLFSDEVCDRNVVHHLSETRRIAKSMKPDAMFSVIVKLFRSTSSTQN